MALWKTADTGLGRPKYLRIGQVTAINITAAGTGYSSAPTVTITAPPAGGVQATATATVAGGLVTAITITNPGAGYTSAPTIGFTGGSGSGATATAVIKKGKGVTLAADVVFVDSTEAAVAANRAKGIRGPGWWRVKQTYDQDGNVRYRTELLVAVNTPVGTSGDGSDDAVVADVQQTITITVQPANQTTVSGAATFGVTAGVAPSGSLTYQWQSRTSSTGKWANVNGATNSTIVLAGQTSGNTGNQYRVVIASTSGAQLVTSSAATLTFGS